MKLENESNAAEPNFRPLILRHDSRRPPISQNVTDGWKIEQSEQVQDDLPEPDGPVMAINSRAMMERLISCTSVTGTAPPRILVTPRASIRAALMSRP